MSLNFGSLIRRSVVVACIGFGFASNGGVAEAGIMEGICNRVMAQFESDVKNAFTRPKTKPAQVSPAPVGPSTKTPMPQHRRPAFRRVYR